MQNRDFLIRLALAGGLLLAAAGCSPAPPAPSALPATEPAAVVEAARTEAALTVVAQLTADTLLHPNASPTLTSTLNPTATSTPGAAAAVIEAATATPIALPTVVASPTPKPTLKPSLAGAGGPLATATSADKRYRCEGVLQSPPDKSVFRPFADFDVIWTIENRGTETWNKAVVDFRHHSGDEFQKKKDIYSLSRDIAPGQDIDIRVDMRAPSLGGLYTTTWGLFLGNKAVCTVSMTIQVVQ